MEGLDDDAGGARSFEQQSATCTWNQGPTEHRWILLLAGVCGRGLGWQILFGALVPSILLSSSSLSLSTYLTLFRVCPSLPFSQASSSVLARQIYDSHYASVDRLCCNICFFLYSSISLAGIFHRRLRIGDLSLEQFYRLLVATGRSHGRWTWFAVHQSRSKRIPAVCETTSRIQILVGMYARDRHLPINDVLLNLWCSGLLAHPPHVLLCALLHDHEKTNYAHVQAPLCANQFWQGKVQRCRSWKFHVWRRYGQREIINQHCRQLSCYDESCLCQLQLLAAMHASVDYSCSTRHSTH